VNGPGSRASQLFLALADVPSEERAAWLDAHCDDPALRREVEALLGALDAPDDFLDPSALHPHVLDADTPLTPGTRIAEFTIQRVIGSGSAGIVYIAQQRHPQRTVALKILRRGLAASSARKRFEVEAELLGQLQHPGIAQIYGAHPGDETIPPFIAMELVDGPPITEYAVEHGLDQRAKVQLVILICEAVQHAHQRGVIHRDLKPANVLVSREGAPKILDFGVARRSGAAVAISTVTTEIGQLVGTVAFMSPEQVTAVPSEVDTRSDVYAIGVILYRLITGRLPFSEDNPPLHELARRIAFEDPPRLSTVDRSFDADLDTILMTALAKEKGRRYQSAADLGADLRRWLVGQPIAAATDSAWSQVRRRLIRYRRAFAAGIVAVIALGGLAVFALVQQSRAQTTAVRLADELAASNIERARLLGLTGNLRAAEGALWHELFERPDSLHARWALWELYARQPALWTRALHPGGASTVQFDDERGRLITAGQDGRIRIVDPASGDVRQMFPEPAPGIFQLAVVRGSGRIVSMSTDGAVRTWDSAGAVVHTIDAGRPAQGLAVVTPDLLATSAGGRVRLWSLTDGQPIEAVPLPGDETTLLDASPDGRLLAIGTERGEVIVWDRALHAERWRAARHRARVSALRFRPDGRVLASGSGDQVVALQDAATGRLLHSANPVNGTIRALAFDASGTYLATAGWWRTVVFAARSEGLQEATDFSDPAWRLDLSADGSLLVTCTESPAGEVRVWQVAPRPLIASWASHKGRIVGLATAGNVPTIASVSLDGELHVQGLSASSSSLAVSHPSGLLGVSFDTTERHLLTASRSGELTAWDVETGARQVTVAGDVPGPGGDRTPGASAFGAAEDGRRILLGHGNGAIAEWHWTGSAFAPGFHTPPDAGEVLGLAVHREHVAVAHRDNAVLVHDASGAVVHRFPTEAAAFTVAFSPDGRRLAVGTWSGAIELWNLSSGVRERTLRVHTRLVAGLSWSPETGLLASASRDGTVRLWDVDRGHALATLASRPGGASRVQVLPRQQLLIGYDDGIVEVRDLNYYFRHVGGQAAYQREVLERARGVVYERGQEVLDWSAKLLHAPGR
jgi:WD40 repeat protein/tRNA A-37 threonylcarbamoyl transferase component Bud32